MGVIQTSKDQALLVTDSTKAQAKGRSKGNEHKTTDSNPKENQKTSERAFDSKKKKKFDKKKCPYSMRGFHPEDLCMKKTLNQLKTLLEQNNIYLPQGADMFDNGENTE